MSNNTVTTTDINQSTQPIQLTQLDTKDYLTKYINEIVISYFNFLNPKGKKTLRTLFFTIGLLIGIDIFKTLIYTLVIDNKKKICDHIVSNVQLLTLENLKAFYFKFCEYLYKTYHNNNSKSNNGSIKNVNDITNTSSETISDNTHIINIESDEVFVNNFINLLESYEENRLDLEKSKISKIKFDLEYDNLIVIKKSDLIQNKTFNNILITYDNININISNIQLLPNSNIKKSIKLDTQTIISILSKKYNEFEPFYQMLSGVLSYTFYFTNNNDNIYLNLYNKTCGTFNSKNYYCFYILSMFKKYFINMSEHESKQIMLNIFVLERFYFNRQSIEKHLSSLDMILSTIHVNVKKTKPTNEGFSNSFSFCDNPNTYKEFNNLSDDIKLFLNTVNDLIIEYNQNNTTIVVNNNSTSQSTPQKFNMNFVIGPIDSVKSINFTEANLKFNQFIKEMADLTKNKTTGKKINVYTIHINETTKLETSSNPDYESYKALKEKYVNEKKTKEELDLLLPSIEPPTIITKTIVTRNITKTLVNTRYCSFENLYLRKKQDVKLLNLIERFKNDKELMEEFGTPNKLGILLYGDPGCGKTTTIVSIASYLSRDIFYVNLKSVKSNEDLKDIFDYVNSQHAGGGIIVFEDIDAMTSMVKQRQTDLSKFNSSESNLTDIIESAKSNITLEYFLNLLDGILTYDNSIVIITTNYLKHIDSAIYRSGRIDNLIELKNCDHYQIKRIFKRFIKRELKEDILNKIVEDKHSPSDIIFHLINWLKKSDEPDEIIMERFIE